MILTREGPDTRLRWVRASKTTWQYVAIDGGAIGTVVLLPRHARYIAATAKKYLGGHDTESEAKQAVQEQIIQELA